MISIKLSTLKKNIAIRCISENLKGYGNFSRALTLAKSLKRNGHRLTFFINSNNASKRSI